MGFSFAAIVLFDYGLVNEIVQIILGTFLFAFIILTQKPVRKGLPPGYKKLIK